MDTFEKIESKLMNELAPEEIEVIEKYMRVTTRIQILENFKKGFNNAYSPLDALDEILKTSGKPDPDAFTPINKSIAMATSTIDQWIEELKKEQAELCNSVVMIIYKISMKDYVNETNTRIKEKVIAPAIPKKVTEYFLTDKFGEGDSPSKDAMRDICTEAVNYFIASLTSGVFDKVIAEEM